MLLDYISAALVTLLVTLDPVALAPIFVSLTRGMNAGERRRVSMRACLIAFGILAFFGLGGEVLLRLLGVGIPAFRISGGLLLFWIAFEMVFERRNERKQHTADIAITEDHIRNVAAFPLARRDRQRGSHPPPGRDPRRPRRAVHHRRGAGAASSTAGLADCADADST